MGSFIRNRIDVNKTNNTIVIGRAHWECDDYCYGCKFRLSNVGLSNCHDYQESFKVMFTQSIAEINSKQSSTSISNKTTIYISIGCSTVVALVLVLAIALAYQKNKKGNKERNFNIKPPKMSDIIDQLIVYKDKILKVAVENGGVRFLKWKEEKEGWGKRMQDLIQNLMLLVNGIMAVVFAEKWSGNDNPLLIINNKFRTSFSFSENTSSINSIMNTKPVDEFVDLLNFWIYLVNMFNGSASMLIIVAWLFTKTGDRGIWIKIRLFNACSMLGSIFIVLGIQPFL